MASASRRTRGSSKAVPGRGTRTWRAVGRTYNLCDAVLGARLAPLGLRLPDHEVLVVLAAAPGITQQELAARCFVAKSGISVLLSQMESDRLVRRESDTGDARAKRLFLTAAGEALARRSLAIQDEVAAAMAEPLTDAELALVTDVMHRVCDRLEELRGQRPEAVAATTRGRTRASPAAAAPRTKRKGVNGSGDAHPRSERAVRRPR